MVRTRSVRPGTRGAMDLRASAPRAATLIYRALHGDIVSLRLKPGEALLDRELETRFGVSRTPIREAILRLADEKLVDIFPQSGTFVSRIPVRALFEAILIRKALEETTVRLAVEAGAPERFDALGANLAALKEAAGSQNRPLFHELDTAFHEEISRIAGFPGIWDTIQQVKVQIDRYRLLTLPEEGRLSRVVEEHGAVLDGLRRADPGAAVAAMGHHLGQMLGELKDRGRLDPDHFIDDGADGAADRLTVASARTRSHAH